MKKILIIFLFFFSIIKMNAHEIHKFYVSIFLIENNQQRKELEIIARIFIDDLEKALEKKYNIKTKIDAKGEVENTQKYIDTYLNTTLNFEINQQQKPLKVLGYEIENDVLICYLTTSYNNQIKDIVVKNSLLTDIYSEQQNIMHFTINGKKSSILLTKSKNTEKLQF